jgi:hypothetical protein
MEQSVSNISFKTNKVSKGISLAPIMAVWVIGSVLFAASGVMDPIKPLLVPVLIWTPVLSTLIAWRRSQSVRRVIEGLDLRAILLFHLLRVPAGIAFLVLYERGLLNETFAIGVGWGDIAVGALAPLMTLCVPAHTALRRNLLMGWNIVAFADILFAIFTATRILFFGPGPSAMQGFSLFPMPVLPSFLVPAVIITHLVIFAKLRRPLHNENAAR